MVKTGQGKGQNVFEITTPKPVGEMVDQRVHRPKPEPKPDYDKLKKLIEEGRLAGLLKRK